MYGPETLDSPVAVADGGEGDTAAGRGFGDLRRHRDGGEEFERSIELVRCPSVVALDERGLAQRMREGGGCLPGARGRGDAGERVRALPEVAGEPAGAEVRLAHRSAATQ